MRARRVAVLALGAALALTACTGAPDDPGGRARADVGEPPLDRLATGTGGSFVTAKDGEIVECRGWGYADSDRRVPADCDTAYDVMSMTKQFTAAAILRLQLAGKLDVTDRAVLDAASREQLFEPRVREGEGSEAFAAYGWVVQDTDVGRVYWHNGGNSWSYGEIVLVPDHGAMTFWVTNRAAGDGFNLVRLSAAITRELSTPLLDR